MDGSNTDSAGTGTKLCKQKGMVIIMLVHSIESLAALDGEGLRYAIFLAGCNLRCAFCHNPDTWSCTTGREYSPAELLAKIKRFTPYFGEGGGVSFSGGEPLLWAGEIAELGALLAREKIGYTIDTSGSVELTDDVRRALDGAELVICDLKFPDDELYTKYTGGRIFPVLNFFDYLAVRGISAWARTVIIPGINDREEMLDRYIDILGRYRVVIKRYQLLGFHTMGFFKYESLGIQNPLENTPALERERLLELQAYVDSKF